MPVTVAGIIAAAVTGGVVAVAAGAGSTPGPTALNDLPAGPVGVQPGATTSTRPTPATSTSGVGGRATAAGDSTTGTGNGGRVTAGAVSLATMPGWRTQAYSDAGRTQVCIAPRGEPCALEIIASFDPSRGFDPGDLPAGASVQELSPCHATAGVPNVPAYTAQSSQVKLDGVTTEFRAFTTGCGSRPQRWEQWTVPTWPAFQIVSHADDLATTARLHDLVTRTARVSGSSTVRITDFGFVTADHRQGGTVTIDLDRASVTVLPGGGENAERIHNDVPRTYRYTLAPGATVTGDHYALLCGADSKTASCPVETYLKRLEAKNPQVRSVVRLVMDRGGKVTEIQAAYGS
jgi:hypothetical protein